MRALLLLFFLLSTNLTMDNAVVPSYQQPLLDAQVRVGGHDAADGRCRYRVLHQHSCVTHARTREHEKTRSDTQKRKGRAGDGMQHMDLQLVSSVSFVCVRLLCFATEELLRCGGLDNVLCAHHGVTCKTYQGVFGIRGYPGTPVIALLQRRHHVNVFLWPTKVSLVFVRTGECSSVIDVGEGHAEHCLMATTKIMFSFYKKQKKKSIRCEVEDFVETPICKPCMILRSRVVRVLCDLA